MRNALKTHPIVQKWIKAYEACFAANKSLQNSMKALWEILVPTVKNPNAKGKKRFYRKRYHKIWDAKVRAITGGLTILPPTTNGEWVAPDGELFAERMIPVRIYCNEDEIDVIADMTAKYYNQLAVMYCMISEKVTIKHYDKEN